MSPIWPPHAHLKPWKIECKLFQGWNFIEIWYSEGLSYSNNKFTLVMICLNIGLPFDL